MKDVKSLLVLALAIGMMGTWVYHIYDKSQYAATQPTQQVIVKDTTGIADAIKDSLQKYYASTLNDIVVPVDSTSANADSLKGQLDIRLTEITKLRNEIGGILNNRKVTKEELLEAKNKIKELRMKVDDMKSQNSTLEGERTKLTGQMEQLNQEMKGLEENIGKLDEENKKLTEIVNNASTLVASEMALHVVDIKTSRNTEVETSQAKKADKFIVAFTAQNSIMDFSVAQIVVVIIDPTGHTITNPIWESGNFDTKKEGRKSFTRILKFEYAKNELKRLLFTLDYDKFEKGNYSLRLYHNGLLIGETSKLLK